MLIVEISDRLFVESGPTQFFVATCARVQMYVFGCAAFFTAGFAYQSTVPLLRITAFFLAPIGFLVPSLACVALDQALAIQAA